MNSPRGGVPDLPLNAERGLCAAGAVPVWGFASLFALGGRHPDGRGAISSGLRCAILMLRYYGIRPVLKLKIGAGIKNHGFQLLVRFCLPLQYARSGEYCALELHGRARW